MTDNVPASPNFTFLSEHDPLLVTYAARAERYVFDDPNTSVLKTRQFAELLARHVAARSGFETQSEEFADVLFVLICLANQTGVDLTAAFEANMTKKTTRDRDRHQNNPKLKGIEHE